MPESTTALIRPKKGSQRGNQTPAVSIAAIVPPGEVTPAPQLLSEARAFTNLQTQADAEAASLFLRAVRQRVRAMKKHLRDSKRQVTQAFDQATAPLREVLKAYEQADAIVSAPVLAWVVAERERAEQAAKDKLAEATADAERRRQQQLAEVNAAAANAKGEEKKLLKAQAKSLADAPILPVVEDVPEPEKLDGIAVPESWTGEVYNLAILVRAVANGDVPLRALKADQTVIDAEATSLRQDLRWPGVRPVKGHSLRAQAVR